MPHRNHLSDKVIGRLSLYRRMLERADNGGPEPEHIFSHELAAMAGSTAALVRRDLMSIGFSGSPKRGYDVRELVGCINDFLDAPDGQRAVLAGVGNLGRALLAHFTFRRPKLPIVAAFDVDPNLTGRVVQGCHCFAVSELREKVEELHAEVGIVTVPASVAQGVAEEMVRGGVKGIMNFSPVALRVPGSVFVENMDLTMAFEKVAFFAWQHNHQKKEVAS